MKQTLTMLMLAAVQASALAATPAASTVTFSQGEEGWHGLQPMDGNGGSGIDTTLGNGAPAMHTVIEHFGVTWSTTSNTSFVRDYTKMGGVTFGIDVLANSVWFFNREVTRDLVVELRDYDNQANGLPYTSVWFKVGTLDASKQGWQHLSVTIDDTSALALPSGWGGYGAEDAHGNPFLPADRTFASVLAGVDEVAFTTFVPGYVYGYTNFDVAVDNISITPVPEPAQGAMLLAGLAGLGLAARRRARR